MDELIRFEVLWLGQSVHFLRLLSHDTLADLSLLGLLPLHFSHLPFESVFGLFRQLVQLSRRNARVLEKLLLAFLRTEIVSYKTTIN